MILEVNKFYDPVIGGVETVVKQYSELLSKYENVCVLCVNNNFSLFSEIQNIGNVKVIRCSSFGTFFSMPISFTFLIKLYYLSKKARIIHLHEPFPLSTISSLFFSSKKRIFVTWHSDIIRQKFLKKVVEYFQKKLCKKSEIIFTTSNSLKNNSTVISNFKEKVKIIPLFINPNDYLKIKKNINLSKLYPKNYVLFLGRLSYYKGLHFFINSINILDNIPILIVGDGELKKRVFEFQKYKKNIFFINRHVSEDEKKDLIKNCKFLVLPSIFSSEAFGIIQLEAMIYSKPVINTNLKTGVPWVSRDKISGITVEVNNENEMSNAIKQLYYNDNLYKKLSIGALRRVRKYFTNNKNEKKIKNYFFRN